MSIYTEDGCKIENVSVYFTDTQPKELFTNGFPDNIKDLIKELEVVYNSATIGTKATFMAYNDDPEAIAIENAKFQTVKIIVSDVIDKFKKSLLDDYSYSSDFKTSILRKK